MCPILTHLVKGHILTQITVVVKLDCVITACRFPQLWDCGKLLCSVYYTLLCRTSLKL